MAIAPMDMGRFARGAGTHSIVYAHRVHLGGLLIGVCAVQ